MQRNANDNLFSDHVIWGLPGSSAGKEFACNIGDPSSIPGSGSSPRRDVMTQHSGFRDLLTHTLIFFTFYNHCVMIIDC